MMSVRKIFLLVILVLIGFVGVAQKYHIVSDASWKATDKFFFNWTQVSYNDAAWGTSGLIPNPPAPFPALPPSPIIGAQYMWYYPYADSVFFRKEFELKSTCAKAEYLGGVFAQYLVDNEAWIYVNGQLAANATNGNVRFVNINPYLQIGKNVIAIKVFNNPCSGSFCPYRFLFAVDVDYPTGPEIVMDPDKYICEGDSVYFGPKDHYQNYKWSNGGTTRSIKVGKAGKYWLVAKDTALCDWIDTVELFTYSHKDVKIGPDQTICTGETAKFTAGPGYTTYKWNNGDTTESISVNYSGTFWVSVTDVNGCFSIDSASVETFDNASVSLGEDTILCKGDSMILKASFPLSVYKWDDGSTDTFRMVKKEGVYSVTVTNHCGSVSDNINVNYINSISVDIGPDDFFCFNQKYELKANSIGANKIEWSTGDTVWKILVDQPGTYSVRVEDKCENVAHDEIELLKGLKQELMVPNSFSPNQDGLNEIWKPVIRTIGEYSVKVIDRWGKLVFETHDVNGGWDGRVDGNPARAGNYIYRISLVDCEFQTEVYTGKLTIVR